jgi:transposase
VSNTRIAELVGVSRPTVIGWKVVDVVGRYLHPPENAVVLCVDEKSQIEALDRTAPILPLQPGLPKRRSHDYLRHGTSTLFAALEIATGQVTAACKPRHRHQEFLAFLRQVTRAYPAGELHLVMDNHAAHKHPAVRTWLAANPRLVVHFTPTGPGIVRGVGKAHDVSGRY